MPKFYDHDPDFPTPEEMEREVTEKLEQERGDRRAELIVMQCKCLVAEMSELWRTSMLQFYQDKHEGAAYVAAWMHEQLRTFKEILTDENPADPEPRGSADDPLVG